MFPRRPGDRAAATSLDTDSGRAERRRLNAALTCHFHPRDQGAVVCGRLPTQTRGSQPTRKGSVDEWNKRLFSALCRRAPRRRVGRRRPDPRKAGAAHRAARVPDPEGRPHLARERGRHAGCGRPEGQGVRRRRASLTAIRRRLLQCPVSSERSRRTRCEPHNRGRATRRSGLTILRFP